MTARGIAATGHTQVAEAAAQILRAGGNAYDAAVAAALTSCVAEPALVSLGACGYLLAAPTSGRPRIYDFGPALPLSRIPESRQEIKRIEVNFGPMRQVFRIGLGT